MKRDFNEWLGKFRDSIANYEYYINFAKVHRNVDSIKVELNILNALIGSKDIENEFMQIVSKYPETLKCIPLLLAVRANEIYAIDGDGEFSYNFKKMNYSPEQYTVFMRKTGLFDLMESISSTAWSIMQQVLKQVLIPTEERIVADISWKTLLKALLLRLDMSKVRIISRKCTYTK